MSETQLTRRRPGPRALALGATLACLAALAVARPAESRAMVVPDTPAVVFDNSPGTGAPPATLGPYSMTPAAPDGRPAFGTVSNVTLPDGTMTFSPSQTHVQVDNGWNNWSNGYTGDVYYNPESQTVTMTLPPGTGAFYFYTEGDNYATFSIDADSNGGAADSGPVSVTTPNGARYFGFYGTGGATINTVTVTVSGNSGGFAVGEFGTGQASAISTQLLTDSGPVTGPVPTGTTVHDSAALTEVTSDAGGTVDYRYYTSEAACAADASAYPGSQPTGGTDVTPVQVPVTKGQVPDSPPVTFGTAGTRYWAAYYSGDNNNLPAVSDCTTEPVQVQATPSVVTTLSRGTIAAGDSVSDSAALTGATSDASGTVAYQWYASQADCLNGTSANAAGTSTVTNDHVLSSSSSVQFPDAGTYYWSAAYSGDANNAAAVSDCEPLMVGQASPSVTTTLSADSIVAGAAVTDQAALTGASPTAGGTVAYQWYGSLANCQSAANATAAGTSTVTNGTVNSASSSVTFPVPGTFYFSASYSGDSSNNAAVSSCEQLTVSKTMPTVTTTLTPGSIIAGGSVSDKAALNGVTSTAGGSVSYRWYGNLQDCQDQQNGTAAGTSTVTSGVVNNSSQTVTFATAGTVYWAAAYSGDGSNAPAVSSCETLVISKASPSVLTTLSSGSIRPGGSVTDKATLTGASPTAGGTVSYQWYSSLANCQAATSAHADGTSGVINGSVRSASGPVTFPAPGTYYFSAKYSGDASNNPAVSSCEQLSVLAVPVIATKVSTFLLLPGKTLQDTAVLTGPSGTVTGTVTFQLCGWAAGGCPPGHGVTIGTSALSGGTAVSPSFGATLKPGKYCVGVLYTNDGNSPYSDAYSGAPFNECFAVLGG